MHDWTDQYLHDVQRFYYQPMLWRKLTLDEYAPRAKTVIENQLSLM